MLSRTLTSTTDLFRQNVYLLWGYLDFVCLETLADLEESPQILAFAHFLQQLLLNRFNGLSDQLAQRLVGSFPDITSIAKKLYLILRSSDTLKNKKVDSLRSNF